MKIYQALSEVNKAMDVILKNQQGHNHKFRGIDQVLDKLGPVLKNNSVMMLRDNFEVSYSSREAESKYGKKTYNMCQVKFDISFVSLEDGSSLKTQAIGEGQDTSGTDKASAMAQSNALKYAIFQSFSIPTIDQKDSDQSTAIDNQKLMNEIKTAFRNFIALAPVEKRQDANDYLLGVLKLKSMDENTMKNLDFSDRVNLLSTINQLIQVKKKGN